MRETVLRHDVLVRERQNQYGRAEKAEQIEKESAVSLSKTAEMCLQILRKMKDQMRFCEHRANRYAIAKDYLETFLAEHGENKHHEEKEDEEEDGGRETNATPTTNRLHLPLLLLFRSIIIIIIIVITE